MAIDLTVNHCCIAFRKPREYQIALEHVDIIVGTCHVQERVLNLLIPPQGCQSLRMPAILPLPCKMIVLPLPMHEIYASNHP
jgi:hypothetical protein